MPNPCQLTAPASLYIHIPFCRAKCLYCDFVSFAGRDKRKPDYFTALHAEIRAQADFLSREGKIRPLKTVYFGGGTPSDVPATDIARTMDLIRERWGFEDETEITVEVNPGTSDPDGLRTLFEAGVNRLSIGLQTANNELLRKIGRIHNLQDFLNTVESARAIGFNNISADLMTGLPGQTLDDVRDSVQLLLDLGVQNISFYALIIEDGTPFAIMQKEGRMQDLPDEDLEREMYELSRSMLTNAGFVHYEVSNSGLPGFEGQHNRVYWRGEAYAACGLGASSYLDAVRRTNTDDLEDYIRMFMDLDEGDAAAHAFDAVVESNYIDEEEAQLEFFLLGFRMLEGVSLAAFKSRFAIEIPERIRESLIRLHSQGFLDVDGKASNGLYERYYLTRAGLDVANFVFMEFV